MLPALASMIMGGLFKQSTGQTQASAGSANPLQQIIEQMMKQGGGFGQTPRPEAPQPERMGAATETVSKATRNERR